MYVDKKRSETDKTKMKKKWEKCFREQVQNSCSHHWSHLGCNHGTVQSWSCGRVTKGGDAQKHTHSHTTHSAHTLRPRSTDHGLQTTSNWFTLINHLRLTETHGACGDSGVVSAVPKGSDAVWVIIYSWSEQSITRVAFDKRFLLSDSSEWNSNRNVTQPTVVLSLTRFVRTANRWERLNREHAVC